MNRREFSSAMLMLPFVSVKPVTTVREHLTIADMWPPHRSDSDMTIGKANYNLEIITKTFESLVKYNTNYGRKCPKAHQVSYLYRDGQGCNKLLSEFLSEHTEEFSESIKDRYIVKWPYVAPAPYQGGYQYISSHQICSQMVYDPVKSGTRIYFTCHTG